MRTLFFLSYFVLFVSSTANGQKNLDFLIYGYGGVAFNTYYNDVRGFVPVTETIYGDNGDKYSGCFLLQNEDAYHSVCVGVRYHFKGRVLNINPEFNFSTSASLRQINFPLLLSLNLKWKWLSLQFGPQFRYLLNKKQSIYLDDSGWVYFNEMPSLWNEEIDGKIYEYNSRKSDLSYVVGFEIRNAQSTAYISLRASWSITPYFYPNDLLDFAQSIEYEEEPFGRIRWESSWLSKSFNTHIIVGFKL